MFHVIDCTKSDGYTFQTRFHFIAMIVARHASFWTGRFHDVTDA